MRIHQILPNVTFGDAISSYAFILKDILLAHGYESRIFAQYFDDGYEKDVSSYTEYRGSSGDILLIHHSVGSDVIDYAFKTKGKKVLIYHNITPPGYFRPFDGNMAALLEKGREQLARYAPVPVLSIGDSEYNSQELIRAGYRNVKKIPVLVNIENLHAIQPDEKILHKYSDPSYVNIVYVGRLAPHKKQENLIKIFHYYHRWISAQSRLILVGGYGIQDPYYSYLKAMIDELMARNIIFAGRVSLPELAAYYRAATIFMSMSEHEGFGIPFLEAMALDVPIIAYCSSAVPETVGSGGVLIKEKKYKEIAHLADIIAKDDGLREKLIRNGRERCRSFDRKGLERLFLQYLEGIA